jgi:poly(3-hydroxybutyrate) depolymerase
MKLLALIFLTALGASAAENPAEPSAGAKGWPAQVRKINYPSSADATAQPAMWYASTNRTARPLLVGLHSWSGDYLQTTSTPYAQWCITNDWIFIHPNFRGQNNKPDATGSELAVKDIISAVEYAKLNAAVDSKRIYLVGASGGGYAAMLMAGRAPEIWAGVSSWVGISDLKAWYVETRARKLKYADDIVKSVGGTPGESAAADAQCAQRSALTYLAAAKAVPLDINTGIHDGHAGSVSVSQSLNAFNLLAAPSERLSAEDIAFIAARETLPAHLVKTGLTDPTYGKKSVLLRRQSGATRLTVFEGGHEIITEAALAWLAAQRKP